MIIILCSLNEHKDYKEICDLLNVKNRNLYIKELKCFDRILANIGWSRIGFINMVVLIFHISIKVMQSNLIELSPNIFVTFMAIFLIILYHALMLRQIIKMFFKIWKNLFNQYIFLYFNIQSFGCQKL